MDEMDPQLFPVLVSAFTGPENLPADLVDQRLIDRIRAASARDSRFSRPRVERAD